MRNFLKVIYIFSLITSTNADARELILTGHPDYPPVIWMSKIDKQLKGIAVELVEKILAERKIILKKVNYESWGRALEQAKQGHVDIILPPYLTKQRQDDFIFTDKAMMQDRSVLFIRKGSNVSFDKFSDLSKYSGVALINDSFGDEFDNTEKKSLTIQRLKKTSQCLKFLSKGRADYLVAGENAGLSVLYHLGLESEIIIYPKPIIETGMYIALSKKSKHFKDKAIIDYINKKISEIKETSLIQELELKYLEEYKKEPVSL